jgi:hypothetical protein
MEKIKSPYFKFEKKFLKDKELLSIVDCGETHNLTIDELKTKKIEILFSKTIRQGSNDFITDLIVKTTNNFYIYLSTTVMETRYMLRVYYKPNDKNFVDLFLKTLKK